MGRRRRQKVRRRPQKRIPDVYPCPRCGNTAIKIELFKDSGWATVRCGSCALEMTIDEVNALTEPVDIYGSFIDRFYEGREVP
jgi:transcription elongation factor Elf1